MTGSNRRPSACKADALPAELITLVLCDGAQCSNFSAPCQTKNETFFIFYSLRGFFARLVQFYPFILGKTFDGPRHHPPQFLAP